ncbi:hypothetical protein NVP1250O_78 [Vibrio phage 1.250.O._10N.261.55.E11]|nr:hypothetical protein NVP1250O_78 [Vibrio phage 1.250.O._10N.261.55.E11]
MCRCEETRKSNDWIYIYYIKDDLIICDRSVARTGLGPIRAKEVVSNFNKRGVEAFYTIGVTIPGALS